MQKAQQSGLAVLDPLLRQAVSESGAYGGAIFLLPPGERTLWLAVITGLPREFTAPWARIWLDADIPTARCLRERHLLWTAVGDLARHYPESAVAAPYAFALADLPLIRGDETWGVLLLLFPGDHPPQMTPGEREATHAAGERLIAALEEATRRGEPVRPEDQPRVALRRRSHRHSQEAAHAAADFAERLPGGCLAMNLSGKVTFVTRTAAELVGEPARDLIGALPWEALPWLSDPVFEDRYRSVLFSRTPASFTALRPPDRWLTFELYPDASGISARIVPAEVPAGATAGAPAISAGETPGGLPSRSVPTRVGALYHLMRLAAVLTQAVEVNDVIDFAINPIMSAFGAQGLALLAVDNGRLRIIGHRGYPEAAIARLDGALLRTAPTPATRALNDGEATFYANPHEMDRVYAGMSTLTGKAAWAYLPLIASGRPVGCFVLAYDRPRDFPPEDRVLLTSLSGLVAQALDRALFYDAQHQLVRRLQSGLLPGTLPEIAGLDVAARYLPATRGVEIGGDFYDLIDLDGTACAAAIGDVQGHNVTAAALMGQVRTAVHATAGTAPGEVLARSNRLVADLDPGLFTSCLYAHVDLGNHRACLATAGHPPPLLRGTDGQVSVIAVPPGPLLGIDPAAGYPTAEVALPPGAVLLLYTDGLVERPGVDLGLSISDMADHLERHGDQPLETLADTLLEASPHGEIGGDDVAMLLISPTPR
ncbi:GAF domain-containing SpoIIE family protein phosphatase [Streptomyces radicis]|uniref:protein-serine/threonine phosphatase n=1 Tax=Streptomyces radicis TaxID=1750517 RepID=A0A3A9W9Z4_9ACTN|nr:SpoIIE family protein phosphatase [Streptomyces radicis]RKN04396.1 PAS sensor protein [Streptomyces radicis]RKN15164.1 PAS sensor protein [Streptomyces radicis]